ncbi:energy-coupling factor transporter transmembrane component T [Brooklawnia cerclae]|uniref:Energy-coupling factor transport system permease protein n=1 Tax=Brooklawnia cerclae TaxID=349934 RepID=A0ABX0SFQ8_9ACTN|nr:energy-coupling factor transporter transmembrane component T [Brooklawnia cerclae]NIH55581.1 energy-coupling factor transport system permease protein [Brooklawnia cerclae]
MTVDPAPHLRQPTRLDRLNPVTRLALAILASVPILATLDLVSAGTMLVCQLIAFLACGVPARRLARRLAPLLLIAPIGAISMALYGKPGGRIWAHWWLLTVSDDSLVMAGAVFLRILVLGTAAIVLVGGADPTRMADGMAQIVRLPERFVLGTLAGVRMIGLFAEDWRTMTLARRARGLGDAGRVRRFATMAFALLVFAIRRGTKLATAMEARGFGGKQKRTWARPSSLGLPDLVGLLVTLAICALSIGLAVRMGTFWFVGWS